MVKRYAVINFTLSDMDTGEILISLSKEYDFKFQKESRFIHDQLDKFIEMAKDCYFSGRHVALEFQCCGSRQQLSIPF